MYYSLNDYCKSQFGCKVYKLSLTGGMTCPNRDGTKSFDGCIFCSSCGSGDFAEPKCESIALQIERAKDRVKNKIKNGKYIAYFQDHTNTYAPTEHLRKIFTEALNQPDIVGLSVATRPDCLPYDTLELLSELNKIKPVFVELGLQTIHESTAKLINRRYDLTEYDTAVRELKARKINVVVHTIIGLPYETKEMIYKTVEYVAHSGADGIKLHLLHVLKGTKLEEMYNSEEFSLPTLEEYTEILLECLRRIPEGMVVHRLTGDGAKKDLTAPLWSADKKRVLNYINGEILRQSLKQGELYIEKSTTV